MRALALNARRHSRGSFIEVSGEMERFRTGKIEQKRRTMVRSSRGPSCAPLYHFAWLDHSH
jgi:hypothetical protein